MQPTPRPPFPLSLWPGGHRIFYGWIIVAAGFIANIAYAEQFSASYGVFIYHIGATTGWGRTVLAGVKTVGRLTEALVAPFIGPLVDRHGARWFMVGGGIVAGTSFMLAGTTQELWQLYLYIGILAPLGGVCLGGFVASVAVANWFVVKRGRAIGIVGMGMSFATMVLPLGASAAIDLWGWRGAFVAMGASMIVLIVPAALFVRRRPEDMGLHPDGIAPGAAATDVSPGAVRRRQALLDADVVWSRRAVLRSRLTWVLVFSWGFAQFAMASTTLHMVPFFLDLGYPLTLAAGALALRSGLTLIGNPIWGYLLERMPAKPAASGQFLVTGIALGMWLLPPSDLSLLAGIVLFAVGTSGGQVVSEIMWASAFGRLSLGTVRGVTYPMQTIFAAMGPLLVGILYDVTGGYQVAFALMVFGCLLSAALVLTAPTASVRD